MAHECRYWIIIQDFSQPPSYTNVVHILSYEIRWSTGWPGIAKGNKEVQRIGPFHTRESMLSFYWESKSKLHGGIDARTIDHADRSECADQIGRD
jgi:hypothetical protein